MKSILRLIGAVILLPTAGCIFPGHRGGGEYRDHVEYHGHGEYREHTEYHRPPEPGVDIRIRAD